MVVATGTARPIRGRRSELSVIRGALDRAASGRASAVALIGEPGIGKSRLATEAATLAGQAGFDIRWGRAWEAGGAPAYWPWRQLCEGLPRDGAIAQLWSGRNANPADPEQARFELFESVTGALTRLADERPLLCLVDDLHAADVPTLELVAFATRHLRACRIAWLLAWRDAEGSVAPVRDQLVRIAREASVVALGPLQDLEANELIDDVCRDANIEMRSRLVRTTAGNPLFLIETLTALSLGHTVEDEQLPLAQGIAAIANERLARLPDEVRELAHAASVVGRDVSLAQWMAAAGRDAQAVRRGASAIVAAGLLGEQGRDRWRFGHDLVREAIYRSGETAEIHRRLALALDADPSARAHHGLRAAVEPRIAIDWTIAAADHARAQCAYEEAANLIERALTWLPSAAQDGALLLARGRALLDLGNVTAAAEAFRSAVATGRKARDPKLVASAALAFGSRYVLGDTSRDLLSMLDEAMAALPESETELQARLLARKAAALTPAADPGPVLEMARSAYAAIRPDADPRVRSEVAVAVGAALTDFAHPHERIPVSETLVSIAREHGDRALELRGLTRLVCDHLAAGDVAAADHVIEEREALVKALVQPRFAWMQPLFRSMRAMMRGDLAVCEPAVVEALTYVGHDPNVTRACAVHRMWFLLYADRREELRAHEPVLLDALKTMGPTLATLFRAVIRLRLGDLDGARREVEVIDPNLTFIASITGLSQLGEVIAEVGGEAMQRRVYDQLAPYIDSFSGWGPFALVSGPPVASILGLLASALGEHEQAHGHFTSALAMTTRIDAKLPRAWTGYWFGRALAHRGDPEAQRVLDAAARDAAAIGVEGLVERCRAAAVTTPAPIAAPAAAPRAGLAWSLEEHAGSWRVTIADRSFLVPNLRGMGLLARLTAQPHVEIHSLELVSGSSDEVDGGDAGELLDDQARAQYRKRIAALADTIEDAEARGDVQRAEAARDEHEALIKELSRAVGMRGKARRAGSAAERARVTAQRRLRDAIKKIGELDTELGGHLDTAIRTGTFCVYWP